MVLVVGELDLSVGMVYALAPFIMFFAAAAGAPMWLAVLVALAAAAGVGAVNAAITILLDVPAFVTTLGTLFVVNGFTLTISGGFPVQPKAGPCSPRSSAAASGRASAGPSSSPSSCSSC